MKTRWLAFTTLVVVGLPGCNPDATLFSDAFISVTVGGLEPVAPGPDAGYVMALVTNSTNQSIEFVVTAEQEEIIVQLDGQGNVESFGQPRILEVVTINLVTDVATPTLAFVFDQTPADFPPVGPGALTQQDLQDVIDQLAAKNPEAIRDREDFRLLRVLRIGLGRNLDVPADRDDGIILRPAGSNPATTAGSVFPSNVNSALSYDFVLADGTVDPADFGNGDAVIFLGITNANRVGGVSLAPGVLFWESQTNQDFRNDTFGILRTEEGPISPPPSE